MNFHYITAIYNIFFSLQVAWVRVDTQTILSIHHNVITQNPRISLTYNDHRSWYLHIREVEENDRGWYMCQVNTDPMRSRKGYLQVVGKYYYLTIQLQKLKKFNSIYCYRVHILFCIIFSISF